MPVGFVIELTRPTGETGFAYRYVYGLRVEKQIADARIYATRPSAEKAAHTIERAYALKARVVECGSIGNDAEATR